MQFKITKTKLLLPILACTLLIAGCQSMNSRFGCDTADYSSARELPPLKFPSEALAASKRYDIPQIPNNKKPILNDNAPPDYCKE